MRVAIIGGGVAGLVCARQLCGIHQVTLFEAEGWAGGHANTVRVDLADETHQVDTGFIVYNERNYPLFSRVLQELGVATQPTEMSFSVSRTRPDLEYRGNGLGLYAQPANGLRPSYQRMLVDVLRFHRDARRLLDRPAASELATLGDLVAEGRYGSRLASDYLIPLGSAIWSANPATFERIPALTVARFLDNHGMLRLRGRPRWRTVVGGSREYVRALVRPFADRVLLARQVHKVARDGHGVTIVTDDGPECYDAAVLATHSDQALALLSDADRLEREVLGPIAYQANVATLHTDPGMMPRRRRAWASWNYHVPDAPSVAPTLTYWMNSLQRLDSRRSILVTLNREDEVDPSLVLGQWRYAHPVYDPESIVARNRRHWIQGRRRTWYCGAYWGYGFHEDAVRSGLDVARELGARPGRGILAAA